MTSVRQKKKICRNKTAIIYLLIFLTLNYADKTKKKLLLIKKTRNNSNKYFIIARYLILYSFI